MDLFKWQVSTVPAASRPTKLWNSESRRTHKSQKIFHGLICPGTFSRFFLLWYSLTQAYSRSSTCFFSSSGTSLESVTSSPLPSPDACKESTCLSLMACYPPFFPSRRSPGDIRTSLPFSFSTSSASPGEKISPEELWQLTADKSSS